MVASKKIQPATAPTPVAKTRRSRKPKDDTPFDQPYQATAPSPPSRVPSTIGACADLLYELREKRREAQKVVDEIELHEKELKEHIIQTLPKSDATGASGKVACVKVVTKEVPQVKDWDAFHKYVSRTRSFELMQKRLADGAVRERWESGKSIPGVEAFTAVTISLTKV